MDPAALLKEKIFEESWTVLSGQELADRVCRRRLKVSVVAARTLLELVRRQPVSWR